MKFLICLLTFVFAHDLFLIQNPDALCLDGSKGSYYFSQGSGQNSNNYIFHFQGGAWISGLTESQLLNSAYKRSETNLGSSIFNPQKFTFDGFFSTDKSINPDFYNWNHININYCDGTGHQGYKSQPIEYNGKKLYFKGDKIVKSIIDEFMNRLQQAQTIIISGCSAGGLASYYWIQHFRNILPKNIQILGIPDSGIFIEMKAIDGTEYMKQSSIEIIKLVNQEVKNPSIECENDNQQERWKCFYAQYLIRYIDVPIFIINSLYDSATIEGLLYITCAKDNTLTQCNQKERNYIEQLHANLLTVINGRSMIFRDTGSFAPSCLEHCFLQKSIYKSSQWQVPYQSGNTLQQSIRKWLMNFNIDGLDNHVDQIDWPQNIGCSNI